MQHTSVCEVSRRLNVLRSKKKQIENWQKYCHIKSAHSGQQDANDENNITWKTPIDLCLRATKTRTKSSGSITIPGV
jgi:hypothetical protein